MEKGNKLGLIAAAISLSVVYAASSAPIPLYKIFSQNIGLTNAELSMTAVAYFFGTLIALLMFGRISDYLGRRPVSLVTLGMAVMGCLIFFDLNNLSIFLIGRFIQGVSSGLASSTIATYVVDNSKGSFAWIASAIASGAPMVGLAIGAFGSGAMNEYGFSLALIFGLLIVASALCAVLIAISPETVTRTRGATASIVPQIRVPKEIRHLLPAATCIFVGTWAIGGFYQAFSASMAVELLGTTNTLIAAAIFACLMAPQIIGGYLAGRFKSFTAQRIGMAAFFMCVMAILVSLKLGLIIPFLIVSVMAAVSCGVAFTGSMRGLLDKTSPKDTAGVLSTIFLISYTGAAVPNLIVGVLPSSISLFEIATGYGLLVALTCIITLFTVRKADNNVVFKTES